jgi:preprotein translocase subunit SecA
MLAKIFGSKNQRDIKRMGKTVNKINALEPEMQALSDAELRAKTDEFRERFDNGETLESLLVEAFAVAREAGVRTLNMRHFDVQLIGGMVLHNGKVAEMRTGEGKTLVATLPAYLNGLTGKGVHLVTVNDYLARRDANWMRPLYEFLGLTVGVVVPNQEPEEKRSAYQASITYGTNNEFGFDYLRDNMAFRLEDKFQKDLNFAIVDEVDSILIDEARTPLIISGAVKDSSQRYTAMNQLVPLLKQAEKPPEMSQMERRMLETPVQADGDFIIEEKGRQVELTEEGHEKLEDLLVSRGLLEEGESLYSATNLSLLHQIQSALKAHYLFKKDVEYIVQDGQIVLIDEHTGRTMPGRRLAEGLHQAIEAKEGVQIQNESQTLASTTFQNYFRLYNKLSGMTGTADTEAFELRQIYGLDVVVIPTNKDMIRDDANDLVYLSFEEKLEAILRDIIEFRDKGAPVLVGTASIEMSEAISKFLTKEKIQHNVLNAKFHEKEAEIIAQAGRPGTVTIATNMAGRGTDIVLGGNWEAEVADLGPEPENPSEKVKYQDQVNKIKADWKERHDQVLAAGGLHIIGTERHESRRIDNQLRGRAGRQGDPGFSRFYLSLDDNLMRIFASERVTNLMRKLGMERGEAIEAKMVTNSIEKAQRKVEGRNFDIRKQLLEFDNVANDQRQIIYQQRRELMELDDISETVNNMRGEAVNAVINDYIPPESIEDMWDIAGLEQALKADFGLDAPVQQWLDEDQNLHEENLREKIIQAITDEYEQKSAQVGPNMRIFEKQITLQVLDTLWKEHLGMMDSLRQGIGLRGYGGKNPKQEYKRESFNLFQELLFNIQMEVTKYLSRVRITQEDRTDAIEEQRRREQEKQVMAAKHTSGDAVNPLQGGDQQQAEPQERQQQETVRREAPKVGRNEPCPCGSGKKYKQCHGKLG